MKYLKWVGIAVALVVLLAAYSFLVIGQVKSGQTPKFDTPDETINYFFATNFAKTGSLAYSEPLNTQFTNPIVFMRWMQSPGVGSALLFPGTFLGFIIVAGAIAKVFGAAAILFLTPLLAVGSVLLMYWGVRQVLGKNVALWSAIILATLPPFFYYSTRTMFHVVPFLFFLLLGVAAYLQTSEGIETRSQTTKQPRSPATGFYSTGFLMLSALGFGGALIMRFADIWWVGLIMLTLLIARPLGWKKTVIFAALTAALSSIVLILNARLYGNPFMFGYPIPGFSASSATTGAARLGRFILPFGFYPRFIWPAFREALWQPYSGFMTMALLGMAAMAIRYWTNARRAVVLTLGCLVAVSAYVVTLYGSWSFSDSPTPGLITIGSSYTRYFLPILVLLVPFVGYLIAKGIGFLKTKPLRIGVSVFMVALFAAWSWSLAYAGDEGLSHVAEQTKTYQAIAKDLQNQGATPEDVFLVRRGEDKILFPDFPRVINVDYLPEEMVRKNLENYSGIVWVSEGNHVFKKQNPFKK